MVVVVCFFNLNIPLTITEPVTSMLFVVDFTDPVVANIPLPPPPLKDDKSAVLPFDNVKIEVPQAIKDLEKRLEKKLNK